MYHDHKWKTKNHNIMPYEHIIVYNNELAITEHLGLGRSCNPLGYITESFTLVTELILFISYTEYH